MAVRGALDPALSVLVPRAVVDGPGKGGDHLGHGIASVHEVV